MQSFNLRYGIKSEAETYERNVLEFQLSSNVRGEGEYATTKPRPSQGSHRTQALKHRSYKATADRLVFPDPFNWRRVADRNRRYCRNKMEELKWLAAR